MVIDGCRLPAQSNTIAASGERTVAESEKSVQAEPDWIALGLPEKTPLGRDFNFSKEREAWRVYFIGLGKRSREGGVTKTDAEIFKRFLSQNGKISPDFLAVFAAHGLKFVNTPYASELIPYYRRLLHSKDEWVGAFAADVLSHYGDKESLPEIVPLLKFNNNDCRTIVVIALNRLGYEVPKHE